MALHLIKLSVGSESVESLAAWQAGRLAETGRIVHRTRMMPKRKEALLDGGSIYWVIKGIVSARQPLVDITSEDDDGEAGRRWAVLHLEQKLVRVAPRAHRPFQGWRYLAPKDAPPDITAETGDLADMPPEMLRDLRTLGLL